MAQAAHTPSTPSYPTLLSSAQVRALEHTLSQQLPPYTLMERAGTATARLALAIAPHARRIWIACGSGNNGGDGLEAAIHLRAAGKDVHVSRLTSKAPPADAAQALHRAQAAGVALHDQAPVDFDLAIDAIWGIGLRQDLDLTQQPLASTWLHTLYNTERHVLSIDIPSGLIADSGALAPAVATLTPQAPRGKRTTLTMLSLKPGLFTNQGTDWAGSVWLAPLYSDSSAINIDSQIITAQALSADLTKIIAHLITKASTPQRPRNTHKGQFGDVGIIGGEASITHGQSMEGAAILAASAALHSGAGRVMLHLLGGDSAMRPSNVAPDIMLRNLAKMREIRGALVCGCGGGQLVQAALPQVLEHHGALVLDADALNAIAAYAALRNQLIARPSATVLTPHPLELARLLSTNTAAIQSDRIGAATQAAQQLQSIVVLKGSGTVIAAPNGRYAINNSGNARLSIGGTGDVLAGCLGAQLAALPAGSDFDAVWQAVCNGVWLHGHMADKWPTGHTLTASRLAEALHRLND
ncbi:MAG: NAD(P)H-hydrate dehydratase [Comamonas sp.]